jgi:DNA-binding response OmpR family regulator
MRIIAVTSNDLFKNVLRLSCTPPNVITFFPNEGLTNEQRMLSDHGHMIVSESAGAEVVFIEWAFERAPELNTLCFHIRKRLSSPIIMICPSEASLVEAIAAGADDATTLPLTLEWIQAQILSYRRLVAAVREETGPAVSARDVRRFDVLRLDHSAHRAFVRDEEVELTPREFALLSYLVDHAEQLCTRDQILAKVWGINFDTGTNMVDVYTYFLRRKLEAFGLTGLIQTVRGHGYRLVHPKDNGAS